MYRAQIDQNFWHCQWKVGHAYDGMLKTAVQIFVHLDFLIVQIYIIVYD